ncbi:MAG: flagella basal body P-ring formation protein FlgA [Pseudomonadota bacterium]
MTVRKTSIAASTIVIAMALSAPAMAKQFQDTRILDALVAAKLGSEIGEPGGARAAIDHRLKLAQCPETPKVSNGMMDSAVVRCESLGWRIRVPINISAQNSRIQPVTTASATQSRYYSGNSEVAIRRGEPVRLTISRPGFSLSRMMVADRNGKIGELIPVRADRRDKPIMARVTDMGEATVMAR